MSFQDKVQQSRLRSDSGSRLLRNNYAEAIARRARLPIMDLNEAGHLFREDESKNVDTLAEPLSYHVFKAIQLILSDYHDPSARRREAMETLRIGFDNDCIERGVPIDAQRLESDAAAAYSRLIEATDYWQTHGRNTADTYHSISLN